MKQPKIIIGGGIKTPAKTPGRPNGIEAFRKWIPCEEFCDLYRLPKSRPPRTKPAKYPTSKTTACRKCCERLAAKGLIETRVVDGRLYVSRESAISFGVRP